MISEKVKDRQQIKNELPVSVRIPFASHIARNTIKNHTGDYLRVFKIEGIAHESADDDDINMWHEQLNLLLRNLAAPDVAIWTHIVRREENAYPRGNFAPGFAKELDAAYKERCVSGEPLRVNELYLTVLFRPHPHKAAKFFAKFDNVTPKAQLEEQQHALEKLDDIESVLTESLKRYEPTTLGCYEHQPNPDNPTKYMYSEMLEFLAFLVNGEWQRIPLRSQNLRGYIATSRPFFGNDSLALKSIDRTVYGSMLGIKEYPPITGPGMLDGLLSLPFSFVLTQSFVFIPKQSAIGIITRQRNIMIQAGDLAESQIEELDDALDDLVSNRFVMGEFHFSLLVLGDSPKGLRDNLGAARTAMSDAQMVVAQEDLVNEAAFWAQLPGNFEFRTRPAPVTSRNFAGLSALHNYPTGKRERNHWGDAVALLKTASGAPYYFNFHRFDLGNTIIIGPSGSGKTVAQGFLLSQLQKFQPTCVFFDKDRGAEIFVRGMRGRYQPLQNGMRTGWNPLQLEPNATTLSFLETWLMGLARKKDEQLSVQDVSQISKALAGVMNLPKHLRRLSQVLSFLDPTNPEGIYYRLQRWTEGNPLGWVFDSEADNLNFSDCKLYGFDMTELLDNEDVRPHALFYLLYRMEEVIDGRRFVCFMDEFWKLLLDDIFEDFSQNKLKVIRKQNGFLVFGTQSARDPLKSKIAHTIIEQCPTQLFMANPKAAEVDYCDGFHLTKREFEIIKNLPDGSRSFLIKQGHNSVLAELNLKGFGDELAVLSGTTANVELLESVIKDVGDDPDVWLPIFQQRRKSA